MHFQYVIIRKFYIFILQQQTEPQYPEILLIAINKNGMNLIDPKSKVWNLFIISDCLTSNVLYLLCAIKNKKILFHYLLVWVFKKSILTTTDRKMAKSFYF